MSPYSFPGTCTDHLKPYRSISYQDPVNAVISQVLHSPTALAEADQKHLILEQQIKK